MQISRDQTFHLTSQKFTLTNSLTTTAEIPFAQFVGAMLFLKANSAITGLAFYGCPFQSSEFQGVSAPEAQTFLPLGTIASGAPVTNYPVTPGATGVGLPFPAETTNAGAIKIVIAGVASEVVEISKKG